jgi:hypothetical protein
MKEPKTFSELVEAVAELADGRGFGVTVEYARMSGSRYPTLEWYAWVSGFSDGREDSESPAEALSVLRREMGIDSDRELAQDPDAVDAHGVKP